MTVNDSAVEKTMTDQNLGTTHKDGTENIILRFFSPKIRTVLFGQEVAIAPAPSCFVSHFVASGAARTWMYTHA